MSDLICSMFLSQQNALCYWMGNLLSTLMVLRSLEKVGAEMSFNTSAVNWGKGRMSDGSRKQKVVEVEPS